MKETESLIKEVCKSVQKLLIQKNKNYGDSAISPSNIFCKLSAVDSICARIDDKLMRIKNVGINDETEDTVTDLIGYLVLLKVAMIKGDCESEYYESIDIDKSILEAYDSVNYIFKTKKKKK
tara:strand:- start:2898 stop:3263 length:366 start_codon:yes stop_codon:yes gene_type:complete